MRSSSPLRLLGRAIFIGIAWWLGLATMPVAGCAGVGWTELPGAPVAVDHYANASANDRFIENLAALRRNRALPEPIVTPTLQRQLRAIADMLQKGEISVAGALRASDRWGRAAYRRDVDVWVIDCAVGRDMNYPSALIERPTAVISFASAHHRPPTEDSDQCATLVVIASGADTVELTSMR
jgi:hypothetical protein